MNRNATKNDFARPLKWSAVLFFLCLALVGLAAAGKNPGLTEYQLKALYLYNFTKFTDWPDSAFASADAPIVIAIVGEDPFGKTLDELVDHDIVRGHPLVVKRLRAGDDPRGCQILFICRDVKNKLPALLQNLKGSPVLTVGDFTDFADQGGMVNLVLAQENVKCEINRASAEEAGLKISAKLLRLARIVDSKP